MPRCSSYRQKRFTGARSYCKNPAREGLKTCQRCGETDRKSKKKIGAWKGQKEYYKTYMRTPEGVAAHLRRKYGYPKPESIELAKRLAEPTTSCTICGIRNSTLAAFAERSIGPFGYSKDKRRVVGDRIDCTKPHQLSNTRILCGFCNHLRGAELYTDEQVLTKIRAKWFRLIERGILRDKDLDWLL